MRMVITLTTLLAAALSSGCKPPVHASNNTGDLIVCLFDVSASAGSETTKNSYLNDFGRVVDGLRPGDTVVTDVITENPTATMAFRNRATLPTNDVMQNPLIYDKAFKLARKRSSITAELVRTAPATQKTAILDALYVVRKLYPSDGSNSMRRSTLILFPDMIEDSVRANFERGPLHQGGMERILGKEEEDGRIPNLSGVDIWVAGATPDRQQSELRKRSIEAFWQAYFAKAHARFRPERYGPALLNFVDDH